MARFFIDSSAILRRVFLDGAVEPIDALMAAGASTSTLAEVEVPLGILRRHHLGDLDSAEAAGLLLTARHLLERMVRVDLTPGVREKAVEMASQHRLRSLDAIQLASAAVLDRIDRRHGQRLGFCTADRRQAEAARAIFGDRRTILLDPL